MTHPPSACPVMLKISEQINIPDGEIDISAIRAQGAGGQNVNKVSSAIHLRFDIEASSLPEHIKRRLLKKSDQRITAEGIVVIKAQNHRSQDKNRSEALARLAELIRSTLHKPRQRIPTKPGRAVKKKRLEAKRKRGSLKKLRGKPVD